MRKLWIVLLGLFMCSCVTTGYGTKDTIKIYDKNWNVKGYVKGGNIYNSGWQLKGRVK